MSEGPAPTNVIKAADRSVALNTIVISFTADSLLRRMVPDADKYIRYSAALIEGFGGGAVDAQTAFQIRDFASVALWISPSHAKHNNERGQGFSQQFLQAVDETRLEEISDVLRGMRADHPKDECWYLSLIGVTRVAA